MVGVGVGVGVAVAVVVGVAVAVGVGVAVAVAVGVGVVMKAIFPKGVSVEVIEYNLSSVTIRGAGGKKERVAWHDLLYVVGADGQTRHREVMNGQPIIVVQPLNPPSTRRIDKPKKFRQTSLLESVEPLPAKTIPEDDESDAMELLDFVRTDEDLLSIYKAIKEVFAGKEKDLWNRLSPNQQATLKRGKAIASRSR